MEGLKIDIECNSYQKILQELRMKQLTTDKIEHIIVKNITDCLAKKIQFSEKEYNKNKKYQL